MKGVVIMEICGMETEITGLGTLTDGIVKGITIRDSRFFSKNEMPIKFNATGILFQQCIFENCLPCWDYCDKPFGAEHCSFVQ